MDETTKTPNRQPAPKRATNRDVAKLAGVSVATVSYVVNERADQHISEATKKKVYQAMNFLNYAPNPYAVGLNTKQSHSIVVRAPKNVDFFTEIEILHFMHAFQPICCEHGYQLSYSMDRNPTQIAATACVTFDMSADEFHALSDENYIPVVAVDSLINDPIFYQVTPDFAKLSQAARAHFDGAYCYVCLSPQNAALKAEILSSFPTVRFVSSYADIRAVLADCDRVALSQPFLFSVLETAQAIDVFRYTDYADRRPQAVFDCIQKALNRLQVLDEAHFVTI